MSHFKDIAHKTLKHIACRPPCALFFISCAKKLQLKTIPAAKCFLCQFPDLSSGAEQKRMGQLRNSRASENHPPLYMLLQKHLPRAGDCTSNYYWPASEEAANIYSASSWARHKLMKFRSADFINPY
jgi:hypothetical protein